MTVRLNIPFMGGITLCVPVCVLQGLIQYFQLLGGNALVSVSVSRPQAQAHNAEGQTGLDWIQENA